MLKWGISNIKSEKMDHLARSTTYKKTGNKSSMDHKKSSWSDARTLWEISSKVCWMTLSLSDGVNVVLLKKKKTKRYPIIFLIKPFNTNVLTCAFGLIRHSESLEGMTSVILWFCEKRSLQLSMVHLEEFTKSHIISFYPMDLTISLIHALLWVKIWLVSIWLKRWLCR